MGINFNALYRALQIQVAQTAPQPAPVATPAPAAAPVEETPYQAASEAQSDAAQGMDAARSIGNAFAGFITSEAAPAPVESTEPVETSATVAPTTSQQRLHSLLDLFTPDLVASIQAQYPVSPEQRVANQALAQSLL
ncbi:MAG: hypothetical protein U0931_24420 [Vulcanimicrobiota bacterium]